MIHCFSGMGNSAAVATRLELMLPRDFADDIWVCPVYSWGIPPVLVRHIETLDLSDRTCHLVCTCGDDTGNIDIQWRKLIESRGGEVGSIFSVRMPNTFVCFPFMNVDSREVTEKKLSEAADRVDAIAAKILSGNRETDIRRGWLPGLKSGVIYPQFFRYGMHAEKFHHTVSCTGCGRCINLCPQKNIARGADGLPEWGADCAFCLRCYHACNTHSVAYGRITAKKGQYLHPDFQWLIKKFKKL